MTLRASAYFRRYRRCALRCCSPQRLVLENLQRDFSISFARRVPAINVLAAALFYAYHAAVLYYFYASPPALFMSFLLFHAY